MIGRRGKVTEIGKKQAFNTLPDIILEERPPKQSQKPETFYRLIERFLQDGRYVELFARTHNLRKGWISIGNQIDEKQCTFRAENSEIEYQAS